jgi:PAS domain S-box-containing protein
MSWWRSLIGLVHVEIGFIASVVSSVTTRDGLHDCWVLVITDLSGHIEAEERFERMFAANSAPAVICRLSDLRFVKLNQGFLAITGYKAEDVLGRSVYEIDVLERAEKRDLAVQRLKARRDNSANGGVPAFAQGRRTLRHRCRPAA